MFHGALGFAVELGLLPRTGGCSAARAAALLQRIESMAAPGTLPATRRSGRNWSPPRSPAAPMTCGTPSCHLWLNASGAPAEVAARAGNSARVLHDAYLHCIDSHDAPVSQRIEDALDPAGSGSYPLTMRDSERVVHTVGSAQGTLSAICP